MIKTIIATQFKSIFLHIFLMQHAYALNNEKLICKTFIDFFYLLMFFFLIYNITGWGTSRFESSRPVSLQPDSITLSRVSAESSSESEAQSISSVSGVKGSSKTKEDRRSGVFRIFGRKGGDKEKEKDKRRTSQTPQ